MFYVIKGLIIDWIYVHSYDRQKEDTYDQRKLKIHICKTYNMSNHWGFLQIKSLETINTLFTTNNLSTMKRNISALEIFYKHVGSFRTWKIFLKTHEITCKHVRTLIYQRKTQVSILCTQDFWQLKNSTNMNFLSPSTWNLQQMCHSINTTIVWLKTQNTKPLCNF